MDDFTLQLYSHSMEPRTFNGVRTGGVAKENQRPAEGKSERGLLGPKEFAGTGGNWFQHTGQSVVFIYSGA